MIHNAFFFQQLIISSVSNKNSKKKKKADKETATVVKKGDQQNSTLGNTSPIEARCVEGRMLQESVFRKGAGFGESQDHFSFLGNWRSFFAVSTVRHHFLLIGQQMLRNSSVWYSLKLPLRNHFFSSSIIFLILILDFTLFSFPILLYTLPDDF